MILNCHIFALFRLKLFSRFLNLKQGIDLTEQLDLILTHFSLHKLLSASLHSDSQLFSKQIDWVGSALGVASRSNMELKTAKEAIKNLLTP